MYTFIYVYVAYTYSMQLITRKTKRKQQETRTNKARALVNKVVKDEDGQSYTVVTSQSDASKVYTVRLQLGAGQAQGYTCNCPDFESHGHVGGTPATEANCKHITAVEMFNGEYEIEQMIKQMAKVGL